VTGTDSHAEATELREDLSYLIRLGVLLTRSVPDAEDLAQEAYLRAAAGMTSVGNRRAYLRRTLLNLHTDHQRRRRRAETLVGQESTWADPDPFNAIAGNLDMHAVVGTLDPLKQQILLLRYVEDLTSSEIAGIVGRPAGTVRRLLAEALSQVTTIYQNSDAAEDTTHGR